MTVVTLNEYAQIVDAYENLKDTFKALPSRVNVDEYLRKIYNHAKVFAAVDDENKVCGLAAAYMNDVATLRAYITLIGVDLKKRRNGIGSMLFESVKKAARENKMRYIRLEVNKSNSASISFYEKHAMKVIGDATDGTYYMECELREDYK